MVEATGYRYYAPWEREYQTLDEAMREAFVECVRNTAFFKTITDGDTVYDRTAIEAYWEAHGLDPERGEEE